jgi:hypothetical protein
MSGGGDYTTTPNLGLYKPNYALDVGQWGNHLNLNSDALDALLGMGPITLGDGTGVPILTFNGASGSGHGLQWKTGGHDRWKMITAASDQLALYAYDPVGNYLGTAFQIDNDLKSMFIALPLQLFASNATAQNSVTGLYSHSVNTGHNAAVGVRFDYNSSGFATGFDAGATHLSIFDPSSYVSLANGPVFMDHWINVVSPNDAASPLYPWNTTIAEWNIVNRGRDAGFHRDRSTGNPTGGLLIVAETNVAGATTGGEGKNATFAYTVGPSGSPNSTGFPAKFYTCFMVEPNAAVGLTGRAIYLTGDITGTASQYPYGPMQADGTWLHGIDHTLATYTDANATTMLAGQGIAWLTGTTGTPTNICRDTAGNGSPEGVVTANKGSTYRRFDGAAASCFYVKESGTGNTGWVAK